MVASITGVHSPLNFFLNQTFSLMGRKIHDRNLVMNSQTSEKVTVIWNCGTFHQTARAKSQKTI
jgi:hypothetical protein